MEQDNVFYVGVDVSKAKHAIAVAEGGRHGEVRYFGEIEARPAAVERFVRKLEKKHPRLHFCYEAGPTGYGLYRQIVELGQRCDVVAPSLIPKRPGERVKTNRRDAVSLARLLRAGELKGIWVPDAVHEAVRDMVRVRSAASEDLRKKRQMLLSFLLRHGRVFTGCKNWTRAHARWLAAQKFDHPAQQIVFQDQVDVITDAQDRLERLDAQLAELVPSWSMAPVVVAYQALRGVSFIVAVTFVSEVGDVRRFDNPRQLMAFLGLVPSERSTGDTVKRGGLTARYRRMTAAGKKKPIVICGGRARDGGVPVGHRPPDRAKPGLRPPGDLAHGLRQALEPDPNGLRHPGRIAIAPGALHQDATRPPVAGQR